MFRKLALATLTALSFSAPASAVPLNLGGTWMFTPEMTGSTDIYYADVERQDAEGDILVVLTDMYDRRQGYAWFDCDQDLISLNGGDWEYVDHRKHEGWWSDIACNRPVQ